MGHRQRGGGARGSEPALRRRLSLRELLYLVSETAVAHGASVEAETSDQQVAYAGTPPHEPATIGLPW
jgi:hypothetical protein